jgi:hypothetical protein
MGWPCSTTYCLGLSPSARWVCRVAFSSSQRCVGGRYCRNARYRSLVETETVELRAAG